MTFVLADGKSTVSPSTMMQIAPSALQGQHEMLHGTSEGIKTEPSPLAQHHSTLHAMLAHSNNTTQQPSGGTGAVTQHLHQTAIPTSMHPGAYSTNNPDVLAGLAPTPYSTMASYTGLPLSASGAPAVYTSNVAVLGASSSPNPAQMAIKSVPAALPGVSPNTDVVTMVTMASLSKASAEGLSTVTLLSGMAPHNGGVMYSLAPSPPKAVPVMMDTSEGYMSGQDADRTTPSGGSPHQAKSDVITLAPAQISTGAQ